MNSADAKHPLAKQFETPLQTADLDTDGLADWFSGQETPIAPSDCPRGPIDVVWTQQDQPDWHGLRFGRQKLPGTRHLRIGLNRPIEIGTVIVRGGGTLSVLKPDAAYPGDLGDDDQWIPAERLSDAVASPNSASSKRSRTQVVSTSEVLADEYAFWLLPVSTKTRALRFTHHATAIERDPSGYLGGVWILSERVANVAPQGVAVSGSHPESIERVLNGTNDRMWNTWANAEKNVPTGDVVDEAHAEWMMVAWKRPVELSGVALLWNGFDAAAVEVYTGDFSQPPTSAPESSWKKVSSGEDLDAMYPRPLVPHWLAFDDLERTTAVRLKMTAPSTSKHEHLRTHIAGGRRVWLGELAAIKPLHEAPLSPLVQSEQSTVHPPIPIHFQIAKPGVVTLVINDENGQRVRNLISETPFPAGSHTVWWDASDDVTRDLDSPRHGLYQIPTRLVGPGSYTVRGLWRDPLKLVYEMSVYSDGNPAWETDDGTGCWMTNHTPPTSVAFVPGDRTADGKPLLFMGAYVSEGGHGLQWVREDGTKVGGQGHVGGHWTGAPTLSVDTGEHAIDDDLCYVASVWEGELRITAKTKSLADREIYKQSLGADPRPSSLPNDEQPTALEGFDGGDRKFVLAGTATHDGHMYLSFPRQNELRLIDVRSSQQTGSVPVDQPRGMAFDDQGRLLVLSDTRLLRAKVSAPTSRSDFEDIGIESLEDPRHITIDAAGRIYISDRGSSHQIKVFAADGNLLRSIGKPGPPTVGPYDPLHINTPNGIAIDSQGHVWVAESDFRPKRISIWNPHWNSQQGATLVKAFYGPGEYGGGGVLDPVDQTRFYYKGLEFRLDWKEGTDELVRVFHRPADWLRGHYTSYSPDTPLYPNLASENEVVQADRYFTSCYTTNPTSGDRIAFVWLDHPDRAQLVAGIGAAQSLSLLKQAEFRVCWPKGLNPNGPAHQNQALFAWSDLNGDERMQPNEITMRRGDSGGVTIKNDLSAVFSRLDKQAVQIPAHIDSTTKVPTYAIESPVLLVDGAHGAVSSGGDQALTAPNGWTMLTNAPEPFSAHGLGGALHGKAVWSYPSLWPGLHASHEAAVPDRPGMVIGHTRLLGDTIHPDGQGGDIFCVNGNMGNMYLFTADGLFVATLFHDIRLRPTWSMPRAIRGMDVSDTSLHDENFWPSITQTIDKQVHLVDGARSSIVRIDGLESIRRFPAQNIRVTADDLLAARKWFDDAERTRQANALLKPLSISIRATPPTVDGDLSEWSGDTDWAVIDRRGQRANFNSDSKPYNAVAAVSLSNGKLFGAFRTSEKDLLRNSGLSPTSLFKSGGCLDLMLATGLETNPKAPREPQAGDIRLLVTQVEGKTRAMLYRAVVPGTIEPEKFSSPWRTITLDVVQDVSDSVQLATNSAGHYEFSIPLRLLDWKPQAGQTYRGDVGVLRGNGRETTQRVYWSNKATAITSDVPSEAQLSPSLWGTFQVEKE
ncbi:NHL repeat containing protein [Rhodopirellula islandica]|nr:NHL repeat containing protein [Rhodopirellula islandica]